MRVVALEEHFTVPAVVAKYIKPGSDRQARPLQGTQGRSGQDQPDGAAARVRREALQVAGRRRHHRAGAVELRPRPRPGARRRTASRWRARSTIIWPAWSPSIPKRFAGFAALPMATPDACADELRRAVKDLKFVGAHDPRHRRRPLPRSSELRRPARRRRRARRADLHPSERADARRSRRPTTPACRKAPTASSAPPAGAGIRRSRSRSCAWCSPAPSTSIPSSRWSSATWAKCCR